MTRSAVVTGAGRGIGYGIAKCLAENGYAVLIAERDEALGKKAESALSAFGKVKFVVCDVSKENDVRSAIEGAANFFGRIDLLVNNAAIANPITKPLTELSLDEWNARLAVNLTSVFLCAKYALPYLKKQKGSIVNISSTRALMSEPNSETYAAAKGGMDALTHALSISFGPDVRVNCIRPGWIDTRDERFEKPLSKKAHAQHPVGRVGTPEDIAELVLYLASERAGFVTGQCFDVDGGMTRKMIYEE